MPGDKSSSSIGAIEAEKLAIVGSKSCHPSPQNMESWTAHRWSGDQQLFCAAEQGGYVTLQLDVRETAEYQLDIYFTKAPDFGIVEVSLDGKKISRRFDGYDPEVVPSGKVSFGTIRLTEASHLLRFTVVDKDRRSKNYHMAIDCLKLQPVESRDQ